MNFVLNLITFVLIIAGLIMVLGTTGKGKQATMNNLNYDAQLPNTKAQIESSINGMYVKGVVTFILGIGMIVARIFS